MEAVLVCLLCTNLPELHDPAVEILSGILHDDNLALILCRLGLLDLLTNITDETTEECRDNLCSLLQACFVDPARCKVLEDYGPRYIRLMKPLLSHKHTKVSLSATVVMTNIAGCARHILDENRESRNQLIVNLVEYLYRYFQLGKCRRFSVGYLFSIAKLSESATCNIYFATPTAVSMLVGVLDDYAKARKRFCDPQVILFSESHFHDFCLIARGHTGSCPRSRDHPQSSVLQFRFHHESHAHRRWR